VLSIVVLWEITSCVSPHANGSRPRKSFAPNTQHREALPSFDLSQHIASHGWVDGCKRWIPHKRAANFFFSPPRRLQSASHLVGASSRSKRLRPSPHPPRPFPFPVCCRSQGRTVAITGGGGGVVLAPLLHERALPRKSHAPTHRSKPSLNPYCANTNAPSLHFPRDSRK
jgi:hypothetical protein